jgi:hypothetical protein
MTWERAVKGMVASRAIRTIRGWPADMQDHVLERLGLERKNAWASVFGGLGFFALGVLAGSAIGLMFAPMSGQKMRTTLRQQGVKGVVDQARTAPPVPSA